MTSAPAGPLSSLRKAELHVHLEGSIDPRVVSALTARHGQPTTPAEVRARYGFRTFPEFIEAFKWVTSYLRDPEDYALAAASLGENLLAENVAYAEVTLSVGVMLLRGQQPERNFAAIRRALEPFAARGLAIRWIFDAVRQFGADAAMRVVESARSCASEGVVAFGIGGDERSVETREFQTVYRRAAELGLHLLMHAGEMGGPQKIREAVELLGAERIGHGIAAIHDPALMDLLAERRIALEVCPASNIQTGALAAQLGRPQAAIADHPLPLFVRHGIPVVLSTDDPAMFQTTLGAEYHHAAQMGLSEGEIRAVIRAGFDYAFDAPGAAGS